MRTRSPYSLFLLFDVLKDRLVSRFLEARLVTCPAIVLIAAAETLWTEVEGIAKRFMDAR